jgi:hypothetical protein
MQALLAERARHFTVTFVSGTPPETVVLHADYTGPATPSQALYDAGDGNWRAYTTNTITMRGSYLKLKGDWRTVLGRYKGMMYNSLAGAGYTCEFSGTLDYAATAAGAYQDIFRDCTRVVAIRDNPFQPIVGSPAVDMFRAACNGMSGVTGSLPAGFMDTSGLTGSPAANMFLSACQTMFGVTGSLPAGFLDTSGLTGSPAAGMFQSACYGMSGVTGSLPAGFMDTSGLTGSPAANMFRLACYGMSKIESGDFAISTNVTLTAANIAGTAGPLGSAWRNMAKWTGQVYWGTNVIHHVLTPDTDTDAFRDSVLMPEYDTIDANWK